MSIILSGLWNCLSGCWLYKDEGTALISPHGYLTCNFQERVNHVEIQIPCHYLQPFWQQFHDHREQWWPLYHVVFMWMGFDRQTESCYYVLCSICAPFQYCQMSPFSPSTSWIHVHPCITVAKAWLLICYANSRTIYTFKSCRSNHLTGSLKHCSKRSEIRKGKKALWEILNLWEIAVLLVWIYLLFWELLRWSETSLLVNTD